jgi:hypothetical protein
MDIIQRDFLNKIKEILDGTDTYYYTLPINFMYGIRVSVHIVWRRFLPELTLEIWVHGINTKNEYNVFSSITYESEVEMGESFLDLMKSLTSLKYSKTLGLNNGKTLDPIHFKFLENENIRLEIESCCVCSDDTKHKTVCGHYYCFSCHQQNNLNSKHDLCPLCRRDLCDSDDEYM